MSDVIRFVLNGAPVEVRDVPPTLTLLRWLRDQAGLTGTKEGCAEGDCGACTVALADHTPDGEPTWRAVDSCLLFLPALQGRAVRTIEGLGGDHPVQNALIDTLASQCGYCTPGFALSLFEGAHRRDLTPDDKAGVDDQLCGNLCRCTGYRPIRDAARKVVGTLPDDGLPPPASPPQAHAFTRDAHRWTAPGSLAALYDAVEAEPDARLIAGGTDLALEVTQGHRDLPALISLDAVHELRGIARIDGGWRIGAGTLLADVEAWSRLHAPALAQMMRWFASRQIKNRGTLGGNLCNASPVGDTPPPLIALDAQAIIGRRGGERRLPLEEFFIGYRRTALGRGEVLLGVFLPDPPEGAVAASFKVSKRKELDISAVSAGFRVCRDDEGRVTEARLAYGGMAATPKRAALAEAALIGRTLAQATDDAVAALDTDFHPLSDHRGSAWYRSTVAKNLLRAFCQEHA